MCWWDSQSAPFVVLLSEVWRNVSGILPTAWWNLSTHASPVPERLWLRNLLQLCESVYLTSVGLNIQISVGLKAILDNEFEAQCTLCKRTLKLGTLGMKALVSHTKSEKHWLASKSLQRSHAITHCCMPLSAVPGLISSTSARSELWRLVVKRHSNRLHLNSDDEIGGALDFEHRLCVCVCVCVCVCNNPSVCVQNKWKINI